MKQVSCRASLWKWLCRVISFFYALRHGRFQRRVGLTRDYLGIASLGPRFASGAEKMASIDSLLFFAISQRFNLN